MSEQIDPVDVAGVNKRFGGLQALSDVGLTIRQGQIYGLIGPNGAGKTTFFNVITGLYTPDCGHASSSTASRTRRRAAHEVAKAGIARTFQNIRLFADMTALENVMVGRHVRTQLGPDRRGASARRPQRAKKRAIARARAGAARLRRHRADTPTTRRAILSYGDQRRLEIARALATDPKLLALDEPAAGMNATEKAGAARAARQDPRGRQDDPADRARREAGDGPVRPRDGARLRQADRRRAAGRRAEGPEGDRGISGSGGVH